MRIEGPPDRGQPPRPLGARLAWFGAIAAASAVAVALAAVVLEALLPR